MKIRRFNEGFEEDQHQKDDLESSIKKTFVLSNRPAIVDIEVANDENVKGTVKMMNGDTIKFDSYLSTSPYSFDDEPDRSLGGLKSVSKRQPDYLKININGDDQQASPEDIDQGIYGVWEVYKKWLKNLPGSTFLS